MKNFIAGMFWLAVATALVCLGVSAPAAAAEDDTVIVDQSWSFSGPFGTFDRGQLQRGFKVYQEVCASCHAMHLLHYRNLAESGGPEFSDAAVQTIAAGVEVEDGPDDEGEMFERPGRPSDAFISPFKNVQEARAANNGTVPPDLSVIAKGREHGVNYLYSLLTGYAEAPADYGLEEGMFYNISFPGHQIAMPNPLSTEVIEYTDGTPPTVENYARDVSAFLMWAAEPKLEKRHRIGFRAMVYLILLAGFLYVAKRRIWARIDH
jgi:cytochrome c1